MAPPTHDPDVWLIDLDNTVITAPRDGQVSELGVRLGQYVSAGTQLLYLVPEQLWIIANYKETQTFRMRPGQPVSIAVEILPYRARLARTEVVHPRRPWGQMPLQTDHTAGRGHRRSICG